MNSITSEQITKHKILKIFIKKKGPCSFHPRPMSSPFNMCKTKCKVVHWTENFRITTSETKGSLCFHPFTQLEKNPPTPGTVLPFLTFLTFLTASILSSDVFWQVDPFTTWTIVCIALFCSSSSDVLKDSPLKEALQQYKMAIFCNTQKRRQASIIYLNLKFSTRKKIWKSAETQDFCHVLFYLYFAFRILPDPVEKFPYHPTPQEIQTPIKICPSLHLWPPMKLLKNTSESFNWGSARP